MKEVLEIFSQLVGGYMLALFGCYPWHGKCARDIWISIFTVCLYVRP